MPNFLRVVKNIWILSQIDATAYVCHLFVQYPSKETYNVYIYRLQSLSLSCLWVVKFARAVAGIVVIDYIVDYAVMFNYLRITR